MQSALSPNGKWLKLSSVTEKIPAAVRGTFGSRSVWQVVQAISWGWESSFRKNAEKYRFPTEQEFRSMFWQDIVGGANGLICFYFPKMRKHAESFEENWTALCRAGEEVKRMMPVILSVEDSPSVVGAPDSLAVRTWMHEGFLYIAAVEIDEKPIKAVLKLSGGKWELLGAEIGPEQRMSAPDTVEMDLPDRCRSQGRNRIRHPSPRREASLNFQLVRKDHGKPTPFEITKFNHLLGLEIHKNVKLCVLFVHKSVIKSRRYVHKSVNCNCDSC